MSKAVLFFAFAMVLLAGIVASLLHNGESRSLSDRNFSFGRANAGSVLKHEFVLSNTTNNSLRIIGIEQSCSCTAVRGVGLSVAPGDRLTIPVEVRLPEEEGDFRAEVALIFQDQSLVRLLLTGEVVRELPMVLSFGKITSNAERRRLFRFKPNNSQVGVTKVVYPEDIVDVEWGPDVSKLGVTLFIVSIKDTCPSGQFDIPLTIHTTDETQPRRIVTLTGRMSGPVEADQDVLSFGRIGEAEVSSREIRLKAVAGRSFQLVDFKSVPEGMFYCDSTAHHQEFIALAIGIACPVDSGVRRGTMIFRVRLDDGVEHLIPVEGAALGPIAMSGPNESQSD